MAKKVNKKPWPTKEAMSQVYEKQLWGSNDSPFYSGEGSHLPTITGPYIEAVTSFLSSFKTPIVVCDLGCGDFNIGKKMLPYTKEYHAIDIVPELILYNKKTFHQKHLIFHCLDISKDILPAGDCAIVRQVLQHLSNTEIQCVLGKLTEYKYNIITEHVPQGNFEPNSDIISGQGIRLKKQSGVAILEAPFHFKILEERELTSIVLPNNNGIIRTMLYRSF